jgi:hypothetical protein
MSTCVKYAVKENVFLHDVASNRMNFTLRRKATIFDVQMHVAHMSRMCNFFQKGNRFPPHEKAPEGHRR